MDALVLEGSPRALGQAHGETLRDEIARCLAVYRPMWGLGDAELEALTGGFAAALGERFGHLLEEIQGIAAGSGLPEAHVLGINARAELLSDMRITECTAVGVGRNVKLGADTVLAQNWDWLNAFRDLTRVVEVRPDGKPAIKMLIEPGMIGKIGLNAAGLGVCLNFLPTDAPNPRGVPVHVLLRAILECATTQEAVNLVEATPRAACANYLIGDRRDEIVSLETRPDRVSRLSGAEYVAHTNSFNADGEFCERQQAFEQALKLFRRSHANARLTPQALKETFTVPGVQFPAVKSPAGIETIHTVVLNLTQRRLLLSDGARSDTFEVHPLT